MFRKDLKKPDGRRLHLYSLKPISDSIVATNPPHEPVFPNPQMRWHPLRGEWVAYASHRQNRTFLPPKEYSPLAVTKSADFPTELPAGDYNVAVFENLFPSLSEQAHLLSSSSSAGHEESTLFPARAGTGVCEVVVFTQDPEASLGSLSEDEICLILKVWGERTKEIGSRPDINYVMPFENRGVEVGVTLHHPHGQIYSYPFVPPIPARMNEMELQHYQRTEKNLVGEMIQEEIKEGRRLILSEEESGPDVKAFVPTCARYPYETWVAPVRSVPYLHELSESEFQQLAKALKTVLMKFDQMWDKPFPYLMVLYQAPTNGKPHPEAHAHFQIFPPYRTRDKLKFLAGTELGAGFFINDSWPEEKAAELRAVRVDYK
jgi:UDPglucose--hexose-1-phosphate uridylyltransferase